MSFTNYRKIPYAENGHNHVSILFQLEKKISKYSLECNCMIVFIVVQCTYFKQTHGLNAFKPIISTESYFQT